MIKGLSVRIAELQPRWRKTQMYENIKSKVRGENVEADWNIK